MKLAQNLLIPLEQQRSILHNPVLLHKFQALKIIPGTHEVVDAFIKCVLIHTKSLLAHWKAILDDDSQDINRGLFETLTITHYLAIKQSSQFYNVFAKSVRQDLSRRDDGHLAFRIALVAFDSSTEMFFDFVESAKFRAGLELRLLLSGIRSEVAKVYKIARE